MRRCGLLTVVEPIPRFRTFGSFLDHERTSKQSMQGAGDPKWLKVSAKGSFPMASPESTNPRSLYTPRALAACEKALRTILTNIGAWGTRLFLIGGMTPRYLVGTIPQEMREHIGSTDLDIVVGVSLATEEAEAYRTLQQNLRAVQFAPARNPDTGQEETFRWERNVDGVRVLLEFF